MARDFNKYKTPTYNSWQSMKRRCNNKNHPDYTYYGAVGIKYDSAWETFQGFVFDMGLRPDNTSLDRIDCSGNYSKDNCRWATRGTQAYNRNDTLKLRCGNKVYTSKEVADVCGVKQAAVQHWVRAGKIPCRGVTK